MQLTELEIPELMLLTPRKFGDSRGFFSETYNLKTLAEVGLEVVFVQDNQAFSAEKGTLRGLHFQSPPFAQDKLVRVLRGRILDVAVDIRKGSPTYGRHVAAELSATAWNQLFVPVGFAHGYLTIEPDTEVFYKVSNYYAPEHDHGVLWNDPDLGIAWPVAPEEVILSEKDQNQPLFRDFDSPFVYSGP